MGRPSRHPLEEGQSRRSIRISLPRETWEVGDRLVSALEEQSPGISPVVYGHWMIAGLVRFRQRVRMAGSSLAALTDLMREFDEFEASSESLRLWPRTAKITREARDVDVSLPEDTWRIFDDVSQVWRDAQQPITVEMLLGYYMLFGLRWAKELLLQSGNIVTAMKQLLLQVKESGEVG